MALPAPAQVKTEVPPTLERNLEGEAVDRDVIVFLPSSYAANRFVSKTT
jgi:hypothetical protein